jgi:hypothetical protein
MLFFFLIINPSIKMQEAEEDADADMKPSMPEPS